MVTRNDVFEALTEGGFRFSVVEHPAAMTTQEADDFIEGHEGVRTKSLFLVNRKRTASYLVIMDDQKQFDLGDLAGLLGESRLSFGSAERLEAALGLEPGVVSPFGMIDPARREVQLIFDEEMLQQQILTFHPGDNRATVFINTTDMLAFLSRVGVAYRVLSL